MARKCICISYMQLLVGIALGATVSVLVSLYVRQETSTINCHHQALFSGTVDGIVHAGRIASAQRNTSADRDGDQLLPQPQHQKQPAAGFHWFYQQLRREMNNSLYRFDRPGGLIPLMQITEAEKNRAHRVAAGREWLKSQGLVVAATVRNGMAGLPSTVKNLKRLRNLFKVSWMVFVENDSSDNTRRFLYDWTRTDPSVVLLGCGTVNSLTPCRLDIRYSSGRSHIPGWNMVRNYQEQIDRGLVMSALRNEYLDYVYDHFVDRASLLLLIDPDVSWSDWDLDNIAQGAYYFMAKPKLQQLCAHAIHGPIIYDPCSLAFFLNKHFGEDMVYPHVDYDKSVRKGPADLPPVKVQSCFQAFAFHRLADMARPQRLLYTKSHGEWICEHNTLSRQLQEVYLDPQMRLNVAAANVG